MRRPGRKGTYPWEQMAVGDSFLIECDEADRVRRGNSAQNSARSFAKTRGLDWRFSFRQVEGGVRIWRVK